MSREPQTPDAAAPGGPANPRERTAAPAPHEGGELVNAAWAGTGVFAATAIGAAVVPDILRIPALVVALTLFALGCVAFLWGFAVAVGRSRTDEIGIGGLFFLAGDTAPAVVRRRLLTALAIQVVVAFATAAVRPFTSLAFGILVPVFGLGVTGLWGARHGTFPRRRAGQ
jgi:hypothetical protein